MHVDEINDSIVFKIHVSHEVQLPNSTSNPAPSRYSLHRFLLLLGDPEVIFCARLFPEVDNILTPKSFRQLKQRHLYPQARPCEKHGHFVFRPPSLSWQDVEFSPFLLPAPHLHWVSCAEFLFPHPMHLHFAVHFRLAMEHGHDLPFLSLKGCAMQDLVLIFRFLPQLQNWSFSVPVSVIVWAGTASAVRKAKRITP